MAQKKIVTKIIAQKRKGRFNVYVNDKYAFPVSEEVMIKFHIFKEMELNDQLIEEIKDADDFSKLYNYAVNYLSYQLRTEQEIMDKFKNETENLEKIELVINRLKNLNLLSDRNYAESYVRSVKNEGNKGPKSIFQKLNQKGIDQQTIEDAINQFYSIDDIHNNAFNQAEKIYHKNKRFPYNKKIEKVKTALMQKGYEFDIINQVIEEADFEKNDGNEHDLINQEGMKIFNKYRNLSYNERVMKSKQALVRKGFSFDDINLFFNEIKNKELD